MSKVAKSGKCSQAKHPTKMTHFHVFLLKNIIRLAPKKVISQIKMNSKQAKWPKKGGRDSPRESQFIPGLISPKTMPISESC